MAIKGFENYCRVMYVIAKWSAFHLMVQNYQQNPHLQTGHKIFQNQRLPARRMPVYINRGHGMLPRFAHQSVNVFNLFSTARYDSMQQRKVNATRHFHCLDGRAFRLFRHAYSVTADPVAASDVEGVSMFTSSNARRASVWALWRAASFSALLNEI